MFIVVVLSATNNFFIIVVLLLLATHCFCSSSSCIYLEVYELNSHYVYFFKGKVFIMSVELISVFFSVYLEKFKLEVNLMSSQ